MTQPFHTGVAAMTLFQNKYRIASARLKDWDYAGAGWYFVTVCAHQRRCDFGAIAMAI